jgi:hypothetical protein
MEESREYYFKLLADHDWDKILELESKYRTEIKQEPYFQQIINDYLFLELLKEVKNFQDVFTKKNILYRFYSRFLQHRNKTYNIKEGDFENLVIELLKSLLECKDNSSAYKIALKWEELEYAKKIVVDLASSQTSNIIHSKEDKIKLSSNNEISNENYTIPLFKSKREKYFFDAIREKFPSYLHYPNVALSCSIEFSKISKKLSQEEKEYFFKGIVDCVVYDVQNDNFIPKYFFELDSIYHDDKKQKNKDEMKNKIMSLAGIKLYRIRPYENCKVGKDDYIKLISDIFLL